LVSIFPASSRDGCGGRFTSANCPAWTKKVRVAFDWTLDLLFPKDVCAVHDRPYRRDFPWREHAKDTVGDSSQYQSSARQAVHSSIENGLMDKQPPKIGNRAAETPAGLQTS
jgi:hypothetical protein